MNTRLLTGALCAAFLVCSLHGSPAQTDAPSERPGKPHWKKHGKPGGPMAGLPPEEAQRLAAARDKAKDDPTVRSLKEARDAIDAQLENAMSAAILAADPGLAPTLEKVKQSRDRAKGMRDRFESLTPEQRQQLRAARQAAKDDPEVVAAREKMKSADSPGARREAGRAMREAMKAAMLKKDPGLADLMEKLGPPPPGMEEDGLE
jgi:Spy/CpxP family protein refolding chaperone